MAYYSGNAASIAALKTAIQTACVAEGWTLNGEVLSKSGCFFRVWDQSWGNAFPFINGSGSAFSTTDYSTAPQLYIMGGTGVDGSNVLTGKANTLAARLGPNFGGVGAGTALFPFAFPINYEIFIHDSPDEVYVLVNHDGDMYQHIAFGHSPLAQATGGTGAWFGGSMNPITNLSNSSGSGASNWIEVGAAYSASGGNGNAWSYQSMAPLFFNYKTQGRGQSVDSYANVLGGTPSAWDRAYFVHQGVDAVGWQYATSSVTVFPHLVRGPNAYNSNAPLLRAVACVLRVDQVNLAPVVDIEHARLLRIDNYTPGDIITLGADNWKVFPWFQRNTLAPAGSNNSIRHTGALGWAVRYDGP